MNELYEYMKAKMDEMHQGNRRTVTIDSAHFLRLRQMLCYMMQIRLLVNQDEELERMLEEMRACK